MLQFLKLSPMKNRSIFIQGKINIIHASECRNFMSPFCYNFLDSWFTLCFKIWCLIRIILTDEYLMAILVTNLSHPYTGTLLLRPSLDPQRLSMLLNHELFSWRRTVYVHGYCPANPKYQFTFFRTISTHFFCR